MGKRRRYPSMFDEYREMTIEKLDEGYSLKEIFNIIDHDSGFYEYGTFVYFVRSILGYKHIKADCENCQHMLWVFSPTARKMKPVCLPRQRIMRTDFKDKPFKCENYRKAEFNHGR